MQQEPISEAQKGTRQMQRRPFMGFEHVARQQTVAINRGLFLVRYAAAEDETRPPRVMVCPEPDSVASLRFLLHPDHDETVLWQPGSCLAVQATAPGMLSVHVIPMQEDRWVAATVRIEPLSQGNATASAMEEKQGRSSAVHDRRNFNILGHVSGLGDVVVDRGEWLAGPSAPSRIEGISINWPGKPADIDIHYAVKTAKPQPSSDRKMALGSFAGSRGKAIPVVGLMLEMSGPGASDFQFSVDAIFLSSPALHITGKRVVASGPTGREPLVGLRIGLEPVGAAARTTKKPPANSLERSSDRVRVFRSRQHREKPAPI